MVERSTPSIIHHHHQKATRHPAEDVDDTSALKQDTAHAIAPSNRDVDIETGTAPVKISKDGPLGLWEKGESDYMEVKQVLGTSAKEEKRSAFHESKKKLPMPTERSVTTRQHMHSKRGVGYGPSDLKQPEYAPSCIRDIERHSARDIPSKPPACTMPPASSLAMSVLNQNLGTTATIEESSSMIPCTPVSNTVPGAEAVDGPDASHYDDNVVPSQASMEPIITATLVENNEDDLEGVHEQLRAYEQQLERMRRERENVADAEVIPPANGEEAAVHDGFNGDLDPSIQEREEGHGWSGMRKKQIFVVAAVALVVIGIVIVVRLSVSILSSNKPTKPTSQDTQQTSSPPTQSLPAQSMSPSPELLS